VKDFDLLYFGTAAMLILCIILILFVVWATATISKQKIANKERDEMYIARFNIIENTMKDKFEKIIDLLLK
jgi:hypothetical protein